MRPDSPLLGIYVRLDTAYCRLREAAYELDQLDGEQAAPGTAYEARALADAVAALQRALTPGAEQDQVVTEQLVRPSSITWRLGGLAVHLTEDGLDIAQIGSEDMPDFDDLEVAMQAARDTQRYGIAPVPKARP